MRGRYPDLLSDPARGPAARELFANAQELVEKDRRRKIIHRPWGVRFLSGEQRRRRYHRLRRRDAHERIGALAHAAPAKGQSARQAAVGAWPTSSRRARAAMSITSAPSPSPPATARQELAEKFDKDNDQYNSIMAKALADRLAEAFAEYLHKRARAEWGYGKNEQAQHRGSDSRKISRHPPRARLSRPARPHREAANFRFASTSARPPASR